ncbi:hypothetical protein SFRURICE_012548, partial [Spodoptera frugiperda]
MRVNMSMAIVAMTEDDIDGSFDWSMQTQSYVLTSFLWGYIVLQIPSGALEARYGAKVLLMLCIFVNSGISLTIPSVAHKVSIKFSLKNTPWKKILTCCPFYALLTSHCGHNWGFWTLITELPTYMNDVLGVHITQNGLLLAIPYMTLYLLSFPFGFMTDLAMKHNWCSISACRKICNSIGEFGPAIMLIVLCQVPAGHVTLTVAMLSGVVGLSAGHLTGIWLTHIDMTPNFAGSVMGITNFFANITGIIAPLVAGAVIADEDDPRQWHTVFYISSGIYFVTNLVYIIFGSSEVQPWNDPDYMDTPTGTQKQRPSVTERNSISRVRRLSA